MLWLCADMCIIRSSCMQSRGVWPPFCQSRWKSRSRIVRLWLVFWATSLSFVTEKAEHMYSISTYWPRCSWTDSCRRRISTIWPGRIVKQLWWHHPFTILVRSVLMIRFWTSVASWQMKNLRSWSSILWSELQSWKNWPCIRMSLWLRLHIGCADGIMSVMTEEAIRMV